MMEPLPDYFGEWQLANWMGITRAEMDDMPIHEILQARVTMVALNRAQNEANQGGKRGRK